MKMLRTLILSAFTLAILMYIAYLLGKSVEGLISPIVVWLLLAASAMRQSTRRTAPQIPPPHKNALLLQT